MLTRPVAAICLSLAVTVAGAGVAAAGDEWGAADCSQNPLPGCELSAGRGGAHGTPRHDGGEAPRGGSGSEGGGESGSQTPKSRNPDLNRASCSYQPSDYQPPPEATQASYAGPRSGGGAAQVAVFTTSSPTTKLLAADPQPGESGAWYVYKCAAGGVRDALYRPPVWIPDAPQQEGGAPQPTPAQLAQMARDQLRLPSPEIESSPANEQLVGLPTWLWLDREGWGSVSATASVPGVSVTATARPVSVDWAMGDGNSVTCKGPGTPYDAMRQKQASPSSTSPDCGHTYRTSSAGQPDNAYPVSATVHWTVTWAGAGESGEFPGLTTTSDAAFRVAESQALNTGR